MTHSLGREKLVHAFSLLVYFLIDHKISIHISSHNQVIEVNMSSSVSSSSLPQGPVGRDPGYKYDPMDPMPGQKYVEFSKDGSDGESKVKGVDPGLDVHKKGKYIYLSRVEHPAPTHNLHVGDRVIAMNGKRIEKYNDDLAAMKKSMTNNNVVRLVVDPTMLRK